jgi:hypothetical protein
MEMRTFQLRAVLLMLVIIAVPAAWADDYTQEWGPQVGTAMPAIAAPDQDGVQRALADIQGENGVLILFNRSADW